MPVQFTTEAASCEICKTSQYECALTTGQDYEYATTEMFFSFVSCTRCHLVYIKNRPTPETLSIIYPQNYYAFSETKTQNPLVKLIRDFLEKKKSKQYIKYLKHALTSMCDIGCGDGRLLDLIQNSIKPQKVYGVEIGDKAAKIALDKGYEVKCGNIEFLDLSMWSNKMDLVLMHQVLEHVRSPREVIRKVYTLLNPGGLFSIETPDTKSWDFKIFKKKYWGGYHIPRHFFLFNKYNIRVLLEQEGFEVVSCKSILSPVFWIHSVHNLLIDHPKLKKLSHFFHYQNPLLLMFSTFIELVQVVFFLQSSNQQVLAKKK